jgi:pSer/pThr/pTyr-binding forkhead associated (FHA) protein
MAAATPKSAYRLVAKGPTPITVELPCAPVILGKGPDCGICIPDDEYLSRQHVRISVQDGMVLLEDLCSSNGTFLKVRQPTILNPGDEFLAGTYLLRLEKKD